LDNITGTNKKRREKKHAEVIGQSEKRVRGGPL